MQIRIIKNIIYGILIFFNLVQVNTLFSQEFYILDNELSTLQFQESNQLILGIYLPSNRQPLKINAGLSIMKNFYLSVGHLKEYEEYTYVNSNRNSFDTKTKGRLFTVNFGMYKLKRLISKKGKDKYHNPSISIGYSNGTSELFVNEWYSKFQFDKIYFQIASNILLNKWEGGAFLRINRLKFKEGRVQTINNYYHLTRYVNVLEQKSKFGTIECKLQIRRKIRAVKIAGGISFELALNPNYKYNFLEWGYYHLGINVDLKKLIVKKSDS